MNVSRTLMAATCVARVRFGPRPGPGRGAQDRREDAAECAGQTGRQGRSERARGSVPGQALPATGPHPGGGQGRPDVARGRHRRRLDGRDSPRRRSPLAGRGQGPVGRPRRRAEHRAAPRLSPRPDRPGAGQEVRLSDQPGRTRSSSRPRAALPGRPTRSSGSSSSATAAPTRPSRRRSPTGRSCRSPTT